MAKEAETQDSPDNRFDFVGTIKLISENEKSPSKGDYNTLKEKLGHDVFKTMATLGYIRGGFYIKEGKIVDTYCVTQSYKYWNRRIKRQTFLRKFFPNMSF